MCIDFDTFVVLFNFKLFSQIMLQWFVHSSTMITMVILRIPPQEGQKDKE